MVGGKVGIPSGRHVLPSIRFPHAPPRPQMEHVPLRTPPGNTSSSSHCTLLQAAGPSPTGVQTLIRRILSAMRPVADPQGPRGGGLKWSPWLALERLLDDSDDPGNVPGIYRVRRAYIRGLLYVGMSTGVRGRLRGLRNGHHVAYDCVRSYETRRGPIEVSWCELGDLPKAEVLGIEIDLISAHRRWAEKRGIQRKNPACQFGGKGRLRLELG